MFEYALLTAINHVGEPTILTILLSIAILGAGGLFVDSNGGVDYHLNVDQVLANRDLLANSDAILKVYGVVEPGSIKEIKDQKLERTFILVYEGKRIRVHHLGSKPDTFRDLTEVVAVGRFVRKDGEYMVEAVELRTQSPSNYRQQRKRVPSISD